MRFANEFVAVEISSTNIELIFYIIVEITMIKGNNGDDSEHPTLDPSVAQNIDDRVRWGNGMYFFGHFI
jgi:hypothetical protein